MSVRIRALQARKAEQIAASRALMALAEAENRDFTAEELAQFNANATTLAGINASIERENALAIEEAGMSAVASVNAAGQSTVTVPARASLSVVENHSADPNRGFATFGEYARSVRAAGMINRTGQAMDSRLIPLATAPSTFAGEGSGADGGILVPPGFSNTIFTTRFINWKDLYFIIF